MDIPTLPNVTYSSNPNSTPLNFCSNFNITAFNQNVPKFNSLFVMNFNIRSFNSNFDDFLVFLKEMHIQPDIIILSETWFMGTNTGSINGYYGYHCTRNPDDSGNGGGVSVFVKIILSCKIYVSAIENLPELEYIHIKLNIDMADTYHIIALYRPPNGSLINRFFEKIDTILDRVPTRCKLILAGDLNINGLSANNNMSNLNDTLISYSLKSHIILPTRPSSDGINATQIDHIWSNIEQVTFSGIFNDIFITDHFPNFIIFPTKNVKGNRLKIFRDHSETCLNNLNDEMFSFTASFPMITEHMDFNTKFNFFCENIRDIYQKCCPLRQKNLSADKIDKPWIDKTICNKIKRKFYLFKRYKVGAITFQMYNDYKLQTEKDLKIAKRNYFQRKFANCKGDSKNTWKMTKKLLDNNNQSPNNISILDDENNVTHDDVKICQLLNSYFVGVGESLSEGIQATDIDPCSFLPSSNTNSFFFLPTDSTEICSIVSKFKNKNTSVDKLPIHVIKVIIPLISPIIAQLFNESITIGIFPEVLKTGCVIPLYKSGSRSDRSNYRPITTLSVFSKIFEKLVHKRMTSFIRKFKIIHNNQFGFQENKCTADAILEFLDNAYESLNENQHLLSIYLDFSKAFDTISIDILLKKLDHYGFRNQINSWLQSYLTNRKQFVKIGNSTSQTMFTKMGVPQGSTLGPLLFILYISDMNRALSNMKILHFADDSTLYFSYNKNSDCTSIVNYDLEFLNKWLLSNKLFLNITKTKYMIIHNRGRPPELNLNIGGSNIDRCEVHKFLGIHIDDRLTFSTHTKKLNSKISRNLGMLRKIKFYAPKSVLKNIYFAFINSHFTYAITAYGFTNSSNSRKLSKLIDKSIKVTLGVERFSINICKSNKIFNFNLALEFFSLVKMHQILHSNLHEYFTNRINNYQIHHSHNTRFSSTGSLNLPHMRFSRSQKAFIFAASKYWNKLPVSLKDVTCINKFKMKVKNHLLNRIN